MTDQMTGLIDALHSVLTDEQLEEQVKHLVREYNRRGHSLTYLIKFKQDMLDTPAKRLS